MDVEEARQVNEDWMSPERKPRYSKTGSLTEQKRNEEFGNEKKKTIFGKKRDQSQPAQRITGASKLIKKIQTKENPSKVAKPEVKESRRPR